MATKRISQTGMADSLVKFERNKKLLGGKGALGIEAEVAPVYRTGWRLS